MQCINANQQDNFNVKLYVRELFLTCMWCCGTTMGPQRVTSAQAPWQYRWGSSFFLRYWLVAHCLKKKSHDKFMSNFKFCVDIPSHQKSQFNRSIGSQGQLFLLTYQLFWTKFCFTGLIGKSMFHFSANSQQQNLIVKAEVIIFAFNIFD